MHSVLAAQSALVNHLICADDDRIALLLRLHRQKGRPIGRLNQPRHRALWGRGDVAILIAQLRLENELLSSVDCALLLLTVSVLLLRIANRRARGRRLRLAHLHLEGRAGDGLAQPHAVERHHLQALYLLSPPPNARLLLLVVITHLAARLPAMVVLARPASRWNLLIVLLLLPLAPLPGLRLLFCLLQ